MFSRSEFCLHLGLNPNDEDVRASSQRLFARVPWHPRHACVPYFVCERGSYVPSPVSGAVPVINIASGNTIPTLEDVITFTFFPERSLNASICIITWFKDNIRGGRFRENLDLGNPSEAKVINKIVTKALGMSLVYASQSWWDGLTPEQQNDMWELRLSEIKSQKDL